MARWNTTTWQLFAASLPVRSTRLHLVVNACANETAPGTIDDPENHLTYSRHLGLWPPALRVAISGDTSCLVA